MLTSVNSSQLSGQISFALDELHPEIGMPKDCDPNDVIRLDPENISSDHFLLSAGYLFVPHRFWYFQPTDYCMEEFLKPDAKAIRSAFICITGINAFPATAISSAGKLNLDFLDKNEKSPEETSELNERSVLRKCCDQKDVYLAQEGWCGPATRDVSTEYMNELKANDSVFLRIGTLDCFDAMELTPIGTEFSLMANGHILMDDHDSFAVHLHSDFYCLDDFVNYNNDQVPEVMSQAWYCANEAITARRAASNDSQVVEVSLPKCCKFGEVFSTAAGCQPYDYNNRIGIAGGLDYALLQAVRGGFQDEPDAVRLDINFSPGENVDCEENKQVYLTGRSNNSFVTPLFQSNNGTATGKIQYLWTCPASSWAMNLSMTNFCVENEQAEIDNQTFYHQIVRYCPPKSQVSIHYPILLYTSSIGLLVTFCIYIFAPAQGNL